MAAFHGSTEKRTSSTYRVAGRLRGRQNAQDFATVKRSPPRRPKGLEKAGVILDPGENLEPEASEMGAVTGK